MFATTDDDKSGPPLQDQYDFVVIGGGNAGLVVANRLTEDPATTVLVLEAGPDGLADPRIQVPAMWSAVLGTDLDWDFMTTSQPHLNGRKVGHPQGRVLGGSSAINAEVFSPPSAATFDSWASLGNSGWGWTEVAPYFRKFHTLNLPEDAVTKQHAISWIDPKVRGTDGPVQASFFAVAEDPLGKAWVDTFESLGYKLSQDPYAGRPFGAWTHLATIDPKTKTRSYSASAYYRDMPGSRPNLTVVTGTTVHKILTERKAEDVVAKGVLAQVQGAATPTDIRATREVILAAGAFQSPKLLELSGIGDPAVLQQYGIPNLVDLPGVGANLQDHLMTGISFAAADGLPTGDPLLRQEPEMIQMAMKMYQEQQAGPLAMGSLSSVAFSPIPDAELSVPADFKGLLEQHKPSTSDSKLSQSSYEEIRSVLSDPKESSAAYFMLPAQVNLHNGPKQIGFISNAKPGSYLSIGTGLSHPLSRGTSHIASAEPDAQPTIDPAYLTHPLDIEVLARHMLAVEKVAATAPLANFIKQDGARAQPGLTRLTSLDEAKEYVRQTALTNNHPVGTCAMLPRELGGVVDDRLRVYGVTGLRVVDSSIMPLIPRANVMTTVYAVAEKAADIIKAGYS